MSIDSIQHLIHDIPTWAQFAAQGLAAETATGKFEQLIYIY
jgi:hypothetical protein